MSVQFKKEVDTVSPLKGQKIKDNPKDTRIQIRLDKETIEKLDCLATEQNSDRSKVIRKEIKTKYFITKLKERLEMQEEKFIKDNLKNKISFLQEEHKLLLKIIYKNACEVMAIQNGEFNINIGQSMPYSKIREKTKEIMTDKVLNICLQDLENMDFILNTMRNSYKETEYGIRPLGLEYIKSCKEE